MMVGFAQESKGRAPEMDKPETLDYPDKHVKKTAHANQSHLRQTQSYKRKHTKT